MERICPICGGEIRLSRYIDEWCCIDCGWQSDETTKHRIAQRVHDWLYEIANLIPVAMLEATEYKQPNAEKVHNIWMAMAKISPFRIMRTWLKDEYSLEGKLGDLFY